MYGLKKISSFRKNLVLGTAITSVMFIAAPSYAQVENATLIADPARIGQDLLNIDDIPDLERKIEVKGSATHQAPNGSDAITLTLASLQVDGVGIYGADELDPIYRDKLGTTVSLTEVYEIATALTNKYRNDGYILTQVVVPPQTIESGNVRLRVVEGFVDQIIIEGEPRVSAAERIRSYADNLRENNILNAQSLERYMLLINDLPGITARGVLSQSKTTAGASDLTIIVERDAYEAEVSLDNHGSRFLGPYQASYVGSHNSVFGYNELIRTQFVLSGDKDRKDELAFGSVLYEQPISKYGTKMRFIGSATATEPGDDLDEFEVKGHSQFFSASVSHPFIRSRTTNLNARATFDFRNSDSKNNLEPNTRKDRIRSVRLGATYQFIDSLFGVGVNAVDFEFSQGVNVFGASDEGQANLTRSQGDPLYSKAEIQVQRLQRMTSSVNLLLSGAGQWSATPLLSSEEFGVGGYNTGRGYDSSEVVGDDGISGTVELQWNKPRDIQYIHDYQLFGFVDAGRVWDQDATTSTGKRDSIVSAGIGVRADITENTEAGFGIALPLTRRVDTSNDNDPRYYFNVTHKF